LRKAEISSALVIVRFSAGMLTVAMIASDPYPVEKNVGVCRSLMVIDASKWIKGDANRGPAKKAWAEEK
jgi:hypothetical protein